MNSLFPIERARKTPESLQLLVFYTDFPAGVRAKQWVDKITLLAGQSRKTSVQFWKLDSIPKIGPLKGIIARDASAADVLIIASSAPVQDQHFISSWLKLLSAAKSQRLARGLLLGVLGDRTTNAVELDELLSTLFLCACRAQLDFVVQTLGDQNRSHHEPIASYFKPLMNRTAERPNPMPSVRETPAEATVSTLPRLSSEPETVAALVSELLSPVGWH